MRSPQWSPSDYRIAFLASVSTGTETLAVIDMGSAKHSPVSLLSLYVNDLSLQWIKNNQFVLVDRPSSHVPGSAMLFDSQKRWSRSLHLQSQDLRVFGVWRVCSFGKIIPEATPWNSTI